MRLEKRIRALEGKLSGNRVTLHFADGSTQEIFRNGNYLLDLFVNTCSGRELDSRQAADLDLIRHCVASRESNGGHLVDLIKCFLDGPVPDPSDEVRPAS